MGKRVFYRMLKQGDRYIIAEYFDFPGNVPDIYHYYCSYVEYQWLWLYKNSREIRESVSLEEFFSWIKFSRDEIEREERRKKEDPSNP